MATRRSNRDTRAPLRASLCPADAASGRVDDGVGEGSVIGRRRALACVIGCLAGVIVAAPTSGATSTPTGTTGTSGTAATAAAPTLTWGQPITVAPRAGDPSTISCPTDSFCLVGDYHGFVVTRGTHHWHPPRLLDKPAGQFAGGITGASCSSPTSCAVVSTSGKAYRWNGRSWSRPVQLASHLSHVSCASRRMCLATSSRATFRWNGHRWVPGHRLLSRGGALAGVSCVPRMCMVVGVSLDRVNYAWRYQHRDVQQRSRLPGNEVTSVACTGRSFCLAAGGQMSLRWDGQRWRTIGPAYFFLGTIGLACASRQDCVAIGDDPRRQGL